MTTPVTPEPTQPPQPSQPSKRPWLVPVLITVVAFLAVGMLGAVAFVLATDNSVTDTIDPQPNLSTSAEPAPTPTEDDTTSGYDLAYNLFDKVWNEMGYTKQQNMCELWNLGMDDLYIDRLLQEMDGVNREAGVSDAELESAVRDYLNAKC